MTGQVPIEINSNDHYQTSNQKIRKVIDILSLSVVLHYVVFRFLQSTTFQLVYSNQYKLSIMLSLLLIGIIRTIFIFFSSNSRIQHIKRLVLLIFISVPLAYVAWKQDLKVLVFFPIVALCLYEIPINSILHGYSMAIGTTLLATTICAMTGSITNIAILEKSGFGASYGICNTTDYAAYLLYILLCIWCRKNGDHCRKQILLSVIIALLSCFMFWLTNSRTSLICCIILFCASLWELMNQILTKNKKGIRFLSGTVDNFAILAFPICAAFFCIGSYLYGQGNNTAILLNELFSNRLSNTWQLFQEYGISLFGSVYEMHGWGGTVVRVLKTYDFLDSSYAYLLIRYGLLLFLIVTGLWVWMTYRFIKSGNKRIAYSMAIIAIYGLSESHFVDINYNIFLVLPFCSCFSVMRKNDRAEKTKEEWFPFIMGLCIAILSAAFHPIVLSYLKTFFYLEEWNHGMRAGIALLVCVIIVLLVYFLWNRLCLLWKNKKIKHVFGVLICILLFVSGFLVINLKINKGLTDEKNVILAETDMLNAIQRNASQPIYVLERSELYQKSVGGFDYLVMSPEDMIRKKEGTIITDKSWDNIALPIFAGAQYIQISPYSGVYTFDPQIVYFLLQNNYTWKYYNYSQHVLNLQDLSLLNGLELTPKGIKLSGKAHSINKSWFLDQWEGTYEVQITLSLDQPSLQGEVCTFKLMGFRGEETMVERCISADEFDDNGRCEMLIVYTIPSIPNSEFLIVAEDEVQLIVEKIAWKRVA